MNRSKAHRERNWFVSIESAQLYYVTGRNKQMRIGASFFSLHLFLGGFQSTFYDEKWRNSISPSLLRPAHSAFRTFVVLFSVWNDGHILPPVPFVWMTRCWHFMVGSAYSLIVARLLCIITSSSVLFLTPRKISFDIMSDASEILHRLPSDSGSDIHIFEWRRRVQVRSWCWRDDRRDLNHSRAEIKGKHRRTTYVIRCRLQIAHHQGGDHKTSM